ncbi:UNVERIFIED_CONTAM: hypothetical protein H355_000222, partial [Colinus virginianus]
LCFCLRKVECNLSSSSNQKSSRKKEEGKEDEEDSDSDETCNLGRVWAKSTQWPAPYVANKCQLVEEVVDDLLCACRGRSCHSFTA